MIAPVLICGVLAGLDNLHVCSSIGLSSVPRTRLHQMAIMFGICETAAAFTGSFAIGPWVGIAGPAMMLLCGVAIFFAALQRKPTVCRGLLALPLLLCLDNVAVGSLTAGHPWTAAFTIGIISTLMSCAGLYGAAWVRGMLPYTSRIRLEMAAASCLIALALRGVI